MIIWVFVVLILTSSYTASLTSMLTVEKLLPRVTDVRELQRRGDYIGYQEGSFLKSSLLEMGFGEDRMRQYNSEEQYADALSRGSANGGVEAVFDEIPYLKLFLSQYCDGYTMVGPIYKTDGFGFVSTHATTSVDECAIVRTMTITNCSCGKLASCGCGSAGVPKRFPNDGGCVPGDTHVE